MTKRKKLILAFVIVNFLVTFGFVLAYVILGLTTEYVKPSEPGVVSLNLKNLSFFFACVLAFFMLIDLFFGIFTYKGKKWAAVLSIVSACLCLSGIFGAVAGVIALIEPKNNISQAIPNNSEKNEENNYN